MDDLLTQPSEVSTVFGNVRPFDSTPRRRQVGVRLSLIFWGPNHVRSYKPKFGVEERNDRLTKAVQQSKRLDEKDGPGDSGRPVPWGKRTEV